MQSILASLASSPVFSKLSEQHRLELAGRMTLLHFDAGDAIHEPGSPAPGIDVLVSGTVQRDDPTLATLALRCGEVSSPGEVFTKGSLLLPVVYRHRLRAVTDVDIARLQRDDFLAALTAAAPCAQRLLDTLIDAIGVDIREVNDTIHRLLAE